MGERSDDGSPGPTADRYLEEFLTFRGKVLILGEGARQTVCLVIRLMQFRKADCLDRLNSRPGFLIKPLVSR